MERGYKGVSIDDTTNIPILAYADDLTIISDSPIQLNKALTLLEQYCTSYDLTVNINKTKVLTVSKGKLSKKRPKYFYNNKSLEEVTSFNYLGVTFTRRGVFEEASKQAIARSRTAVGAVKQTLVAASNRSFEAARRVHSASVLGTLLYSAPIWSLRYTKQLEAAQAYFFKKYFSLKMNTPHYIVRREFNVEHVTEIVLKQTLKYINKIHALDDVSLVKKCFKRLLFLDSVESNREKYNWVTQVKQLLKSFNIDSALVLNSIFTNAVIKNINTTLKIRLQHEDSEKIQNSSYSSLYSILNISHHSHFNYLNNQPLLPYHVQRTLAQLRTSGQDSLKITIRSNIYIIRANENCLLCGGQAETLAHIFFHCPHYKTERAAFLPMHLVSDEWSDNTNIASILTTVYKHQAVNIFYFMANALKRRSFLLEE